MKENPSSMDWAGARGERWRAAVDRMEAMLSPIDEPLFESLGLDGPCQVADVACGGGGTTLALAQRAISGTVVDGFDISSSLIELAEARAQRIEATASFACRNVETAAPPNSPYDRLMSRFGIMFFEHPLTAFTRLLRWLRPGGRSVFAVWGPAPDNPWASLVRDAVADVLEVPPSDPAAPGPFRYANPSILLDLLQQAGFEELQIQDWHGELAVGGGLPAPEAARFAIDSFSMGRWLIEAGEEACAAGREALTKRYAPYERDEGVKVGARVFFVTGRAPEID